MKKLSFVIAIILSLAGCSEDHTLADIKLKHENEVIELTQKYTNEMKQQENNYLTQIENLKNEINKLHEELQLSKENKNISKAEEKILDFYNKDYFALGRGSADSGVMVKVNMTEPLRALPSNGSPLYMDQLTDVNTSVGDEDFEEKLVDGELLYTTINPGEGFARWCLVIIDQKIGYVLEENILEYINISYSYDTLESFVGIDLGMTVDQVEELYPTAYELFLNKSDIKKTLVVDEEESRVLNASFNPNTRIIDEIRVFTEKIPLSSGFKVGDDIEEVFSYYDEAYNEIEIEIGLGDEDRVYDIGNGYWLMFLTDDGVVWSISLSSGNLNLV